VTAHEEQEGAAAARTALVIDASTYRATVAVVRGRSLLSHAVVGMRGEREERLMPAVAQALEASGLRLSRIPWIICGSGPGSFTSLRIAGAIAKGLCSGPPTIGSAEGGAPRLGSISSLALIVAGALDQLAPGTYLACLDALRGERYGAVIEVSGESGADGQSSRPSGRQINWDGSWRRASTAALAELALRSGSPMIGPDETLSAWPDAAGLVHLWASVREVDPASWEPDYGRLAEAEVRLEAKSSRA
jgi:tRNA threonylcarbamoyladenosine biosynthesis protein TsaB